MSRKAKQQAVGRRGRRSMRISPLQTAHSSSMKSQSVVDPVPISMCSSTIDTAARERLQADFLSAQPFPHAVIRPFLGKDGLKAVRSDLERIAAKEKETDLFRFFQTADLGPLCASAEVCEQAVASTSRPRKKRRTATLAPTAKSAPNLKALAQVFASDEFRKLCADITKCGELCERVDLSAQIYTRGAHLLCHDDVIGTRKISFIYYLTDPEGEWTPEEGGTLELYPHQPGAPRGTPAACPTKELLPLSDSLALFVVEPGVSFHSVKEVRGGRARVSIQGWLHAPSLEQTAAANIREVATLQQLLRKKISSGNSSSAPVAVGPLSASAIATSKCENDDTPATDAMLTSEDLEALGRWLSPVYLDTSHLKAVADRFADDSYAVLQQFLRPEVVAQFSDLRAGVDQDDGFSSNAAQAKIPDNCGKGSGWAIIGPPHLRRYLRYHGDAGTSCQAKSDGLNRKLGEALDDLAQALFSSKPFRRWLQVCTRLEPCNLGSLEVRRFRPGADYTVAARAEAAPEGAELDATLAFVADSTEAEVEQWSSEDFGGFESYVAADEEDGETAEVQEIYRGADVDGPLVNLPASTNTLCLVMRDAQTLRFMKYLSKGAPSSRVDVAACYKVDAPEGSSDESCPENQQAKADD